MSPYSQEQKWAIVQQRTEGRRKAWQREQGRGTEAQRERVLLIRLPDQQNPEENWNCPYSICDNENKGGHSPWFGTPVGRAVFFSAYPCPNLIMTFVVLADSFTYRPFSLNTPSQDFFHDVTQSSKLCQWGLHLNDLLAYISASWLSFN